jgi:hypothetical protein
MGVKVLLEVAPKRAFASALDWPGWSRAGRTEDDALQALVAYGSRYAPVAKRAKLALAPPATSRGLTVVERVQGGTGTEFGIPAVPARDEDAAVSPRQLERQLSLLRAAWATFDAIVERKRGTTLHLGPRGGGRQVPKIVEHVGDAERSYLAQIGSRAPDPAGAPEESTRRLREAFVETLTARVTGAELANPNKVRKLWAPRYAVRRAAWHLLDHAWEIEDRSSER